ncbi:50S ribosomal protein L9 [Treponema sp.]|uniref:50S ribosomal protein L9 n=1 Tax=Treponema sp. TaxID=166 RepID=UPI003F10BEB6
MKVILNEDVKHLGEMGDVKNVANGYFRNYLFPRMLAVPCTPETEAYFATKKAEIEARKEQKRKDSLSLKEKLEALEVVISMPAGNNGKLYGAVTSQTIADFYKNSGFEIERKKIEIPGHTIKSTGSYSAKIHLYETSVAEVKITVKSQDDSSSEKKEEAPAKKAETPAAETAAE